MNFSESEIQKLFGHEAAEDEDPGRLREYYFKHSIYDQVVTDLPLRIVVGHKGIGKSALFNVAINDEILNNRLTVSIQPDDVIKINDHSDDMLENIRIWKIGISEIIAEKVLTEYGLLEDGWQSQFRSFGGKVLNFLKNSYNVRDGKFNLIPMQELIVKKFLEQGKISVYIDDLDRGWEGRRQDIKRISALLNAVRDIARENRGIFFRISLRSDVYYLSRTSDESTDKTESSVIWFSWTNHEILVLLIKRVESYFGRKVNEENLLKLHQSQLIHYLSPIMEDKFTGTGHWENAPINRVLMSLIRKRPRDLVKLLTLAARNAKNNNSEKILSRHFESSFMDYSSGRLQDTINEYQSELPDIERFIMGMRPSKNQRKNSANPYIYTTAELLKKIDDIQQRGVFRWANKQIAEKKELLAFLYKINFITARKETQNGIDRKYFEENRYLSNKFTEYGYDWEVHPAYRWALQVDESKIFEYLQI